MKKLEEVLLAYDAKLAEAHAKRDSLQAQRDAANAILLDKLQEAKPQFEDFAAKVNEVPRSFKAEVQPYEDGFAVYITDGSRGSWVGCTLNRNLQVLELVNGGLASTSRGLERVAGRNEEHRRVDSLEGLEEAFLRLLEPYLTVPNYM